MRFGNEPLTREVFLEKAIVMEWITLHLNKVQGGGGEGLRSVDGAEEGTPGNWAQGLLQSENKV